MIAYRAARQRVTLGAQLARGGEAIIHEVLRDDQQLAKIYIARRDGYERKLKWMVQNPPDDPNQAIGHPTIAWPRELLFDGSARCIGYLMPRIHGAVKLLEVFNPRLRAQTMPNFNWKYLHRAARNLAAALDALHARNYVVGDLNESNILVMPTALITLIDCDSFQVRAQAGKREELYPCPVARAEYTPPELQGRTLDSIPRLPEHDAFGLGVLIFQLLMDGSHPFRGRWLGGGDPPSIQDRIRDGWFPYANTSRGRVVALQNILPFNALDPRLTALMERCFVSGHKNPQLRPTPAEWQDALDDAERNLVECAQHHFYGRHLSECPWCRLRRATIQTPLPPPRATGRAARQPTGAPAPFATPRPAPPPAQTIPIGVPPFSAPFFYAPARPSPMRVPRTRAGRTFWLAIGALKYAVIFGANLASASSNTLRAIIAFDRDAFADALTALAIGALSSAVLWTLVGALAGALVGAALSLSSGAFVLNAVLDSMWATAIVGASLTAIPGAALGALLESIVGYKETGGAIVGATLGALLALFAPANSGTLWQHFMLVGALVGALFALANLAAIGPPRARGFGLARESMGTLASRVRHPRGLLTLLSGALIGLLASGLLQLAALPSVNFALVMAVGMGFAGGALAATRPAQWP